MLQYKFNAQVVEDFERLVALPIPTVLKGPTGCGKTKLIEQFAQKQGVKLLVRTGNSGLSKADLWGRRRLIGDSETFSAGPLLTAMLEGSWFYLDELESVPDAVFTSISPLLDHRRKLAVETLYEDIPQAQGLNESFDKGIVKAHHNFRFIVSYNPKSANRNLLKDAFRNRIVAMFIDYLDYEDELALTVNETGLPKNLSNRLVGAARIVRDVAESSFQQQAGTRMLLNAARLLKSCPDNFEFAVNQALIYPLIETKGEARIYHDALIAKGILKNAFSSGNVTPLNGE
jgi:nitric oxide reductase NorQ protein